jgi:hypothetical protein
MSASKHATKSNVVQKGKRTSNNNNVKEGTVIPIPYSPFQGLL